MVGLSGSKATAVNLEFAVVFSSLQAAYSLFKVSDVVSSPESWHALRAVPTGCSDPRPGTPSELPAPVPLPADARLPTGPLHLLSPLPTMDTCLSNFSSILSSWGDRPRPSRQDQVPYYGHSQRGASCLEHRSQLTVMHVGHCLVSPCPCISVRTTREVAYLYLFTLALRCSAQCWSQRWWAGGSKRLWACEHVATLGV